MWPQQLNGTFRHQCHPVSLLLSCSFARAQVIAEQLPTDASPLIVRLVHCANPLRTLDQLTEETGIEMPILFGMVQHLQLWGKVRVIHPLTQETVLCVHPDALLRPPDEFVTQFGSTEPGYAALLELFASAQRFGAVIRAAEEIGVPKRRLVQMTLFLLQREALRQLHTYVHCVGEPTPPGETDRSATADAARARWRLFRRLRPMLHGEHHVDEILWKERLSRDVLADLLRAYSDWLVCVVTHAEITAA